MYTKINNAKQLALVFLSTFLLSSTCYAAESASFILKEEVPNYGSNQQQSNSFALFGDTTWHTQPVTGTNFKAVAFDAGFSSSTSSVSTVSTESGGGSGGGGGPGSGKRKDSIDRLVDGATTEIVKNDDLPVEIAKEPTEPTLEFAIHRNVPKLHIPKPPTVPVPIHTAAPSSKVKSPEVHIDSPKQFELHRAAIATFDEQFMKELQNMVRSTLAEDGRIHDQAYCNNSETHILIYVILLLILIVLFLVYYELMQLKQQKSAHKNKGAHFSSCKIYGVEKKKSSSTSKLNSKRK